MHLEALLFHLAVARVPSQGLQTASLDGSLECNHSELHEAVVVHLSIEGGRPRSQSHLRTPHNLHGCQPLANTVIVLSLEQPPAQSAEGLPLAMVVAALAEAPHLVVRIDCVVIKAI